MLDSKDGLYDEIVPGPRAFFMILRCLFTRSGSSVPMNGSYNEMTWASGGTKRMLTMYFPLHSSLSMTVLGLSEYLSPRVLIRSSFAWKSLRKTIGMPTAFA